mmetsp:Transcript_15995/g.48035  ORF Transcript_15995/g.48035 Transcript_15995/m.48035 type:complete len:141 (-) Transcript_15995:446-868(-)
MLRRVLTLAAVVKLVLLSATAVHASEDAAAEKQPPEGTAPTNAEWYFWNEISGETQWEDPGDVAYEGKNSERYWLSATGERLGYDPNAHRYSWVENWSEEHKRPFYYNQRTKASKWEKPADLAWRRVRAQSQDSARSEEL